MGVRHPRVRETGGDQAGEQLSLEQTGELRQQLTDVEAVRWGS